MAGHQNPNAISSFGLGKAKKAQLSYVDLRLFISFNRHFYQYMRVVQEFHKTTRFLDVNT